MSTGRFLRIAHITATFGRKIVYIFPTITFLFQKDIFHSNKHTIKKTFNLTNNNNIILSFFFTELCKNVAKEYIIHLESKWSCMITNHFLHLREIVCFLFLRIRLWRMDEKRTLLLRSDWVFYLFYCLVFCLFGWIFFGGGGGGFFFILKRNF